MLSRMERMKHYLSICNSGPSERLAKIALNHRDAILARNCAIVDENLPKWDAFFARYPDLFDWSRPDGSCMGFPRYKGADGVEAFAKSLVEEAGVLFLPSTIYSSDLGPTPDGSVPPRLWPDGAWMRGLRALDAHICGRTGRADSRRLSPSNGKTI